MNHVAPLCFRSDGTFKIVQFTDMHYTEGGDEDLRTLDLMEAVISVEQPDLVVLTGDIIYGKGCSDPKRSLLEAVAPIERAGVPWAAVIGNHDAERGVTKEELMDILRTCEYCVAKPGPGDISGVGNYSILVQGRNGSAAALYFLDSGGDAPAAIGGYDWIHADQIAWYIRQSSEFAARYGRKLPSLAFFHIPIPEYDQVWNEQICYGEKHEKVCAPSFNSGFGAAMLERGDIIGTFVGHDHVNDYYGDWHGVRLCYGRGTGFDTYGREGFPRGARVIRLHEGSRSFDTWLRLEEDVYVAEQPLRIPASKAAAADPQEERAAIAAQGLEWAERLIRHTERAPAVSRTRDEARLAQDRMEGALRLLHDLAPSDVGIMAKLAYHFHRRLMIAEAGYWHGRLLEHEGDCPVTPQLSELALRLAPVLHLVENEPFALVDCVAVVHPERPVIAYHLFWEDDWNFPSDYMPSDHEIIWVGYEPQTGEPVSVWSYFHDNILHTQEAITEARANGNRPQTYVQWGIHGTILAGSLELTVERNVNGERQTLRGEEVYHMMYTDAIQGGKRRDHPIKQGWPQRFTGSFEDYKTFPVTLDTREYVARHNRIHCSRWANAVMSQRALPYNTAPKDEWPWLHNKPSG